MQERLRDSDYPFLMRIRTSTGIATTGIIGAKHLSFAAFGVTVNLASHIEGLCEPGYVNIAEPPIKIVAMCSR